MNVLSLFDGISCGQVALERAGIKVDTYYASEVDKYAIKVTMKNYPNTIQSGDICNIHGSDLPKIDLLIGGSPCQGFSFAGKQLNFVDPRSKLFFGYVRLLKECNPKYFLLENVKMKKEYQDIISKELGVEPIEINSSLASAQNRKRLYWTNISDVKQPQDRGIMFGKMLYRLPHGYVTAANIFYSKYPALAAQSPESKYLLVEGDGRRKLTPLECEQLQTLPENYTSTISNTQRYKCIGNGWTVDIIAHIFRNIK
jgi:site-specific DNA-cytosine methylase